MRLLPRFPVAFATTSLFLPLLFIADVKAAQLKEARVTQVVRDVKLLPSHDAPRPAAINDPVRDGTAVRTGGESRTELTFADQTLARLGANTIFTFAEGTRNLDLKDGAMLLRVPKDAGGARINTAAVTAAITGTTVMLEYHPRSYVKFIVLEGTGRVYLPGHVGESVLVKAGQMLITKPDAKRLPEAVDVDVSKLMTTSLLITGFRPMGSEPLIGAVEHQQQQQKASGQLYDTNVAIFGGGVTASLSDPTGTSQRDLVVATQSLGTPTPLPSITPKPSTTPRPTPTPSGTPRPTPSVTPSPTASPTPSVTPSPTPSVTPSPTASPTPSSTPTPTPPPTPTPSATTVAYKSISGGNWSDPNSWTPGVVPNNNGSNLYNAVISGGSLTQNIAPGVTIQQLQMSGGTLTLANPLTLKAGLLFSGGNIYNGTLFIEGSSVQSATMDAFGLTINNSGDYDIAFDGSVFGNAPTFNNSGTLRKGSGPGASGFNGRLNNSGTLLSQSGVFSFNGGGTSSGALSADAGAELQIASNFTLASGSQFTGAGLIRFANGTGTSLSGTLINNGRVFINSTGSFTDWVLNGGLSLSGGGSLQLSNAARIRGSGILTNVDNTIIGEANNSGSGLGADQIGIVNQAAGIIDANIRTGVLNVDPSAANGLTNQGLLRASNGGSLLLNGNGGGGFNNTGGTISALDGSQVFLTNAAAITGGLLTTAGTGVIATINSASLTDLTNTGFIRVSNGTSLALAGTINNSATISVNSTGSFTDLLIGANVTLAGGGDILLSNAGRIRSVGTLTNVDNIIHGEANNSGSGLGANELTIINQSAGLVDADVAGGALNVDPGSGGLTNRGALRASNGGILLLNGNGGGGFDNQGVITALDGSEVRLLNTATITGGLLTTSGSGVIRTVNTATLANLTNSGRLIISNGTTLSLVGTINDTGSILIDSTGSFTDLIVNGNVTLTGGSSITLQDAGRIRGTGTLFVGGPNGEAFTIQGEANNSGSGLGADELTVVVRSGGLVDANVSGKTLNVDPGVANGLTNQGLMRASNGGSLQLNGNGEGAFNNVGGTIRALDGSQVLVVNGAAITGGLLTTVGTGVVAILNSGSLTDLTNTGFIRVNNGSNLALAGTITNSGTISVNSTGSFTDLLLGNTVTLNGGGDVLLSNAGRIRNVGTLINVDNTIHGEANNSGSGLGADELTIFNQSGGLVDADVNGGALNVDPGSGGLTNRGTMRASNGGILLLNGNGGGGFDNQGVITALDGSVVELLNGAAVNGGLLNNVGTGVFLVPNSASLTDLTSAGTLLLANGANLTFTGSIANSGTLRINSTGSFTDLLINGNVALSGGGNIILSNAGRIRGSGILTNVDNIISGEANNSGSGVGADQIGIVNQASAAIVANVTGATLNVDPSAADGLTNQGLLRASNGGTLLLNGSGGGGFDNSGTIDQVSGGSILLTGALTSSGVINVGLSTMTISGGSLALLNTSRLSFQLGGLTQGSQYGFINSNGTVGLGGQLLVSFANGFQAGSNDTFTLIAANTLQGSFTNVASGQRLSVTGGPGSFLVTYNGTTLVLSNYSAVGRFVRKAMLAPPPALSTVTDSPSTGGATASNSSPTRATRSPAAPAKIALLPSANSPRLGAEALPRSVARSVRVANSSQLRSLVEAAVLGANGKATVPAAEPVVRAGHAVLPKLSRPEPAAFRHEEPKARLVSIAPPSPLR